jgi:hypothetical protein
VKGRKPASVAVALVSDVSCALEYCCPQSLGISTFDEICSVKNNDEFSKRGVFQGNRGDSGKKIEKPINQLLLFTKTEFLVLEIQTEPGLFKAPSIWISN